MFPFSSFLIVSVILHLAKVSVTAGSMRQYLDATKVPQVVPPFHDGTSIHDIVRKFVVFSAQSQEHWGDSRRQVTQGELTNAVEGP